MKSDGKWVKSLLKKEKRTREAIEGILSGVGSPKFKKHMCEPYYEVLRSIHSEEMSLAKKLDQQEEA